MRRRLFVAADLDAPTRAECARAAERLRATGWPGRWTAPESYHLTVAFLGGVDDARVPDVLAALHDVAPRLHPLRVPLDALGAYPNLHRPRIAWIGPAIPVAAFGALCDTVRYALAPLGFTFDPHVDAHVTVARADGPTRPLPLVQPPRTPPLPVDALTLYESFTERAGARYVALERISFGTQLRK
ncbi:MAG: RNA 2',3'-cyclic phosphodiesterase [Candidatus Eremiobacteraeota bacterium]|nr:RNA 2',3'-cyclic phosphodiesterase [Candidatus Eremiobacteraeota bacterium]